MYAKKKRKKKMICISWASPSAEKQKDYLARIRSGGFNYDEKYVGHTQTEPFSHHIEASLRKDGYALNSVRIRLGTGEATFLRAKECLKRWRHFQLGWASVDPNTPIRVHQKFCVCVKELITWVTTPLEILYVNEFQQTQKDVSSVLIKPNTRAYFAFGSGTLEGHLLAGEEMFAVRWEEDDSVWYEVLSFSKPAKLLSRITYPYVQWRQRHFAKQSSNAMLTAVSELGYI